MRRTACILTNLLPGAALLLAFAIETARAGILYTPVNLPVFDLVELDLDHDLAPDVWLELVGGCSMGACGEALLALPAEPGVVDFAGGGSFDLAALEAGAVIGPDSPWTTGPFFQGTLVETSFNANDCEGTTFDCQLPREVAGDWVNQADRYLGLRLNRNGETRYGWARLSVFVLPNGPHEVRIDGTLTGFALRLEPDQPILAGQTAVPEPSTWILLALGLAGLAGLRRERRGPSACASRSQGIDLRAGRAG